MVTVPKEKSFPRGGREQLEGSKRRGERHRNRHRREPTLFGRSSQVRLKNRNVDNASTERKPYYRIKPFTGQLKYSHITEEMLVLGCIYKIGEHHLDISLPGNCTGVVPITNISEPYSKTLAAVMQNEVVTAGFQPIHNMFKVGQHVVAKVVKREEKGVLDHFRIILSLAPDAVHSECSNEDVLKQSVFTAAVESIEEKGYIMDLGIKSTRSFLKKENARSFEETWNEGRELGIGQLVPCLITKVTTGDRVTTVALQSDPSLVAEASGNSQGTRLQAMLPGMLFHVTVSRHIPPSGIQVRLSDNVVGYVHQNHFSKPFKLPENVEIGTVRLARVLYITEGGTIVFTMKSDICAANPPVSPFNEFKAGMVIEDAVIMSLSDIGVTIRLGKTDRGAVKGFIPFTHTNRKVRTEDKEFELTETEQQVSDFPIGSPLSCRILDYNYMDQYYFCTMDEELMKEKYVHPSMLEIGLVLSCVIKSISHSGIVVTTGKKSSVSGFVSSDHISDVPLQHPEKKFNVGQTCQARVLSIKGSNVQLTMKSSLINSTAPLITKFEDAQYGIKYAGTIKYINEKGLLVKFYSDATGWVVPQGLGVNKIDPSEIRENFYRGQTVYCYVMRKDPVNQKLVLSLIQHRSNEKPQSNHGESDEESAVLLVGPHTDVAKEKKKMKKRNRKSTSEDVCQSNEEDAISQPEVIRTADVDNDTAPKKKRKSTTITNSEMVNAPNIQDGIKNSGINQKPRKLSADCSSFEVLDVEVKSEDEDTGITGNSKAKKQKARRKRVHSCSTFEVLDAEVKSEVDSDDDKEENNVAGNSCGYEMKNRASQKDNVKKKRVADCSSSKILDVEIKSKGDSDGEISTGNKKSKYTAQKRRARKRNAALNLAKSIDLEVKSEDSDDDIHVVTEDKDAPKMKRKGVENQNVTCNETIPAGQIKTAKTKKSKSVTKDLEEDNTVSCGRKKPVELPPLSVKSGFVWDPTPDLLPVVAAGDVEEESSDEEPQKNKKIKRSRQAILAEKRAQAQLEEARLRAVEARLMDPEQLPQTADEFDRLVLSSPDSSMVWLQYMAYHLQATEIEKARAVARRALKTISFREEQEKLNVWVALLNLENLYGTKESLDNTLQEALVLNDPYQVHTQMMQIYAESHKLQDCDTLIVVMTKKYKVKKDMWLNVATLYMKSNQLEKARGLLQRALSCLEKKEHVSVISQFALLENKFGSQERSQTLMEQILTSYPKRVDVWSTYVDMLVKSNLISMARQVLERAVAQKLPSHKMKSLFKKFLAFEETHGTEEGANNVRRAALEYVEAATSTSLD